MCVLMVGDVFMRVLHKCQGYTIANPAYRSLCMNLLQANFEILFSSYSLPIIV